MVQQSEIRDFLIICSLLLHKNLCRGMYCTHFRQNKNALTAVRFCPYKPTAAIVPPGPSGISYHMSRARY